MDKLEFINNALKEKTYLNVLWLMGILSIPDTTKDEVFKYKVFRNKESGKYEFYDGSEWVAIKADFNKPLMNLSDEITASPEIAINLKKPVKSLFGVYLANLIIIVDPFRANIDYINKKFSPTDVENIVWHILQDTPIDGNGVINKEELKPDVVYTIDYERFMDNVVNLDALSHLVTVSATKKNIVPAPGIQKERKKLLKEYGDSISDPLVQAEFEKRLSEFDAEFLKGDPSVGKVLAGKTIDSRRKQHITYGSSTGFDGYTPHVAGSLAEGLPTDADTFVGLQNSSRSGSAGRSRLTIIGGVLAQLLKRATNHYSIAGDDCKTKLTKEVIITSNFDINKYAGSFAMKAGKPVLLQAKDISIGDKLQLRAPSYCIQGVNDICSTCAGTVLSKNPKALGLSIIDMGSVVLYYYMRSFHKSALAVKKVKFTDFIS